jgi:diacylglycerol kinase family enzyme
MIPVLANAVAIVNSRMRSNNKRLLYNYLSELSIPYNETRCAGDAVTMAGNADAPVIIAAGGDGTVNEVLNGVNVDKQKLLILPAGTLNSISNAIGNTTIKEVFTHINHLKEVDADFLDCVLSQSNGNRIQRRVLGFIACGYDGRVVKYASLMKSLIPALRYVLAGWIAFIVNRPFKTTCIVNGVASNRIVTNIMINNCGADRFSTIKKYSAHDHVFEINYINMPYIIQLIHVLLCKAGYNGGYKKITSIELDWKRPAPVMADGELFENVTSISVTVKSGLKLICSGQR